MTDYNPAFTGSRNEGFDPYNEWDNGVFTPRNEPVAQVGGYGSSPDGDYGGYNDWFSAHTTPESSTPGSIFYGNESPSIGYNTPTQPSLPSTPFYSEPSDPIWGTQEPPWVPPTPDGSPNWTGNQWEDFFTTLPEPGWTDAQWSDFMGTTQTVPQTDSQGFTNDNYLDSPWYTPSAPPYTYDSTTYGTGYTPPQYTDPVVDDWIANYQTPQEPTGPVYSGWDDILAAGFSGITGKL